MEPIEIEFLMRDKLSDGVDKAGKSVDSMGLTVDKVAKLIKERIREQKSVVKSVETDLKALEKQYAKLAPGQAQAEMKAEIEACKKALLEEKAALMEVSAEHERTTGSAKKLSMQLREMQDAMARMRLEGKDHTQEYRNMAAAAANLSDTIGDLRAQTQVLAHDNAGLQGVMSGVSGLSGAFTTATGIMGVFASENENLTKIQTKVQSVMAVTMGLQQVMNTLNRDSAFRLVTVARAKELLSVATTKLSVALGISNVAAKALMATLTLGASLVITGLIVAFDRMNSASSKSAREIKLLEKEMDKVNSIIGSINKDVDFDVRIAEACGASKKELIELRLEAAKTAVAIADAYNDKLYAEKAPAELKRKGTEMAKKAQDELKKVMDDKSVLETAERYKKSNPDSKDTPAPYGSMKYWEEVIAKLKEVERTTTGEAAILAIRKQIASVQADYDKMLTDLNGKTALLLANLTNEVLNNTMQGVEVKMSEAFGSSPADKVDIEPLKKLTEQINKDFVKSTEKAGNGLMDIANKAQIAAGMMGELAGAFYEFGEAYNDGAMLEVAGWLDSIGNVINTFSSGIQAALSGDIAGALQAAMSFITNALESSARHKMALDEIRLSLQGVRYEYNLLMLQQQLMANQGGIFGTDNYRVAIDAVENYAASIQKLNSMMALYKTSDRNNRPWMNNVADPLAGLANVKVVTGHKKTGLFGWGKGRDTYSSVLDAFPAIVDANNQLNVEMAQSILNSAKMDDASRQALQTMVDYANQAREAYAQLEEYLSGIFGSFGSDMMSIIVDAFKNGEDAAEKFGSTVTQVVENMVNDMIYSAVFGQMFAKASDDMAKLWNDPKLNDQDRMNQSLDIIGTLVGSATGSIDEVYKLMDYAKEQAKKAGIDIYEPDATTQSGKAGAFASMTQDQGTRLEGMFNAGQIHWANIDLNVQNIMEALGGALDRLGEIARNTSYCRYLEKMASDIETIKRDGLKMQ